MKNTRFIVALVAFAVAFIFSAGLVRIIFPAPAVQYVVIEQTRFVSRSSSALEEFIRQDDVNGSWQARSSRNVHEIADSTMEYWKKSSSMDASAFPQDFQNAWQLHMNAWRKYADYLQVVSDNPEAYSKEMDKRMSAEIDRTFAEVLRLARIYGADV